MCYMKKNNSGAKWIIGIIAVIALLATAAIAIGAYLKKNAAFLNETLDYDDDLFFDEDDEPFAPSPAPAPAATEKPVAAELPIDDDDEI